MSEQTNDDNYAVQWCRHCPLGVTVSQFRANGSLPNIMYLKVHKLNECFRYDIFEMYIEKLLQEQLLGKVEKNELLP